MSDKERSKLFGINVTYNANGFCTGIRSTSKPEIRAFNFYDKQSEARTAQAIISFDKFEEKNRKCLEILNLSIKLLKKGYSGTPYGFGYGKEDETNEVTSMWLVIPDPLFDEYTKEVVNLEPKEIKKLRDIYKLVETNYKGRTKLIIDRFGLAVSGNNIPKPLRFVELYGVLEMIYLPKQNSEQSFRLALRLAKQLETHKHENGSEVFLNINKITRLRGKIIHGGACSASELDSYFPILSNYMRKSLLLYLKNQAPFGEKQLNSMFFKTIKN
ncbi:Uncharacterised protein [uncultured archaeon]|nr:Uncharacterised protein [uncultured archaeon]